MPPRVRFFVGVLVVAVFIAALYSPELYRSVLRLAHPARTEEQARREVVQPPISTPTDVKVKAKLFWGSASAPTTLEPSEIELPLSADPVLRAKQLIGILIAEAPSKQQRTLPEDATLLEFYLLPDGTAIADFSDTLATATPSGILSEQMAVESITRTLAANVEWVRRLKILIHGQDAETLAGHVDLADFIPVRAGAPLAAAPISAPEKPLTNIARADKLTPPAAPGKLGR